LESLSIAIYKKIAPWPLITILVALFSIHRSLILLVMEAGIDIDLATLKLVGTRGFLIALVGSLLPIGIGMLLAWVMQVGDTTAIIAAGAVFGPTSLGIALNILKGGGVLNT
jgi:Kef-type K+ transport system membrane component KefB